ncbi:MAG: hypothetical protein EBY22_07865, partial [Gammaproteobacteria bacterium]|nr:hypothetical protein [Gammaproteobacteria bacterium]
VCQRVILIYFSAKSEMVARLRGHDRFFCHVRRFFLKKYFIVFKIVIELSVIQEWMRLEKRVLQLAVFKQ